MKSFTKVRNRSIAQQVFLMKSKYPHFNTGFTSPSSMKVTGILQPTSRSDIYHFALRYNSAESPNIKILSPVLKRNILGENIPHIYPGEKLCLYHPDYHEFSRSDLLCDTIIPWTSLWLYYYEVWHLTGKWLGGGEHPAKLEPKIKRKIS